MSLCEYVHLLYVICICRLIQEEKETTEQRAEELESRVGSHTNLDALSTPGPGPPSRAATWTRDRSFERSSPPVSTSPPFHFPGPWSAALPP